MKKQIRLIFVTEFLFYLIVIVLPPIFSLPKENIIKPLSISSCVLLLFFIVTLQYQQIKFFAEAKQKNPVWLIILYSVGALALLLLSRLFLSTFATVKSTGIPQIVQTNSQNLVLFYSATIIAACFEECLYRQFLPNVLNFLFSHLQKNILIILEGLLCILFALGHRYLGGLAMLQALIAAIVLRLLLIKTGTLKSACIVHSIYNIIVLAELLI